MISITKLAGREVVASCLSSVSALRSVSPLAGIPQGFQELSISGLSGGAEARLDERHIAVRNERPTQAPAAVEAQASAYAFAVKGADLQQKWADGGFAGGTTSAAEHHTMRAFRGLEPWRDPA
ncbi:hypothetical protein ABT112_29645 [Streptomyces sp. NPDC002055]|uniref:hypothetical protein n=1 Tax=Streptomyces sp. NPDC002055 TaxID=3154534 RepID=UPI00331E2868